MNYRNIGMKWVVIIIILVIIISKIVVIIIFCLNIIFNYYKYNWNKFEIKIKKYN